MKNYIKSIIITVVLCTTVYSQLDSIVFVKWGWHQNTPFRVCDDQNGDGYNDILIIDLVENHIYLSLPTSNRRIRNSSLQVTSQV